MPWSYNPFRDCLADIFSASGPLLPSSPTPTPFAEIEATLNESCGGKKHKEQLAANLMVAREAYRYALRKDIYGRVVHFPPLRVGEQRISYWHKLALSVGGKVAIPFVDPRQGIRLTREGRRFVFSAMHWGIRDRYPIYADAMLLIIQFSPTRNGRREIETHTHHPRQGTQDLIGVQKLSGMVDRTYKLREIAKKEDQRSSPKPKPGSSPSLPLDPPKKRRR